MTEGDKIRALVEYRMVQADEALQAAATNLAADLFRSAANRAYYAMLKPLVATVIASRRRSFPADLPTPPHTPPPPPSP